MLKFLVFSFLIPLCHNQSTDTLLPSPGDTRFCGLFILNVRPHPLIIGSGEPKSKIIFLKRAHKVNNKNSVFWGLE